MLVIDKKASICVPKFDQAPEQYEFLEELGRGKFALVKKCRHLQTGEMYAAKVYRGKRAGRRGERAKALNNEVSVLGIIPPHPRIVKLLEVYHGPNEVVLILELVAGGELYERIEKSSVGMSEEQARRIVKQILEAVKHLHHNNLVHLDIKPENVMMVSTEERSDIKLVDFGLAKIINDGETVRDMVGTPEFVAPEVINFEPITTSADMWSIGVLTYILLSGSSPFRGENQQETYSNITGVCYDFDDESFDSVGENAKEFIELLLVKNPRKRLTVDESMKHPWIATPSSVDNSIESTGSPSKSPLAKDRIRYRRSDIMVDQLVVSN